VPIKVLRLNTEGIKAKGHVQALSPSPQTTRDHGSSTITDLHSGGLSLIFSLNQMGQQYTVKDWRCIKHIIWHVMGISRIYSLTNATHSWSLLKAPRGFSNVRVNSGMRIGPTGDVSTRQQHAFPVSQGKVQLQRSKPVKDCDVNKIKFLRPRPRPK